MVTSNFVNIGRDLVAMVTSNSVASTYHNRLFPDNKSHKVWHLKSVWAESTNFPPPLTLSFIATLCQESLLFFFFVFFFWGGGVQFAIILVDYVLFR